MGYAVDVERMNFKPGDEQEQQARKWLGHAITVLELVTGQEVPWYRNIYIPLGDLSDEQRQQLINDWSNFIRDLSMAGLRYAAGLPLVFGVKGADFENPERLIELYERMHTEFLKFAEDNMLAVAQHATSICVLCFVFSDSQSFDKAKSVLGSGRSKNAYFRRTYTTAWLFNLLSFELVTPKGIAFSMWKMMDSLGSSFSASKHPQNIDEWMPPNKLLTSGIIGPNTFLDFTRLFSETLERGGVVIPKDALNHIKGDEVAYKKMGLEAQLQGIDQKMEESFFRLGEILFERFQTGETFPIAGDLLQKVAETAKAIQDLQSRLETLEQRRKEWSDSKERMDQLEIERIAIEGEFKEYGAQLGESMFEHEQELIKQDEVLEELFAVPLRVQMEINKRKLQIYRLEGEQKGILASVKGNAQVVYLKGLNQKDQWTIRKQCRSAGLKLFDHLTELPASSLVFPVWDKLKHVDKNRESCTEAIDKELQFKLSIEDQVKGLSDTHQSGTYPWNELEMYCKENIEKLKNGLSEPLTSAGREFRLARRTVGSEPLEIEQALSQLEEDQKNITKQLQDLDHFNIIAVY
jgi:hypothetical protein